MAKYRFMEADELADAGYVDGVRLGAWYKVEVAYDIIRGKVFIVKDAYLNLPSVNDIEMCQYVRDKSGHRIGVFVAKDNKVGWAFLSPKDRKECEINWDFGKAIASRRFVSWLDAYYRNLCLADFPNIQNIKFPQLFSGFAKRYKHYLEKKSGKSKVTENAPSSKPHVKTCPVCSKDIMGLYRFCPHCGFEFMRLKTEA